MSTTLLITLVCLGAAGVGAVVLFGTIALFMVEGIVQIVSKLLARRRA